MPKKTVLVIDDEKDIRDLVRFHLEREGFIAVTAKTGEEGLEAAKKVRPDLVVLDLMLPETDGIEICKILKQERNLQDIPVLMLTAKSSETDEVVGFEVGASDYLPKPFSVKVLLARIKNLLRARETPPSRGAVLRMGGWLLDRDRHAFTVRGKPISLTKLEFRILAFLMENPGRVFSRDQLLSGAWEGEAFVVDRTVDVHIRSLRKKLGRSREAIETVRGMGYRFSEGVAGEAA